MSVSAVRAVLERSQAKGTNRLVLIVLAEHVNDAGCCWPSVDLIAKEVKAKKRVVQYALKTLVDSRELTIEAHGAPVGGRWQWRPNLYRVLVSSATAITTNSPSDATKSTTKPPLVVQPTASSGATERHPVVHAPAPKSSEESPEESIIIDDDDLFEEIIRNEAARRVDEKIASGSLEPSKRLPYLATVKRNLINQEGTQIRRAIAANPTAAVQEFRAICWPSRDELWQGRLRTSIDKFTECTEELCGAVCRQHFQREDCQNYETATWPTKSSEALA